MRELSMENLEKVTGGAISMQTCVYYAWIDQTMYSGGWNMYRLGPYSTKSEAEEAALNACYSEYAAGCIRCSYSIAYYDENGQMTSYPDVEVAKPE